MKTTSGKRIATNSKRSLCYRHLGEYSDWLAAAERSRPLVLSLPMSSTPSLDLVRRCLSWEQESEAPGDVQLGRQWERDGVLTQEVSWSVGYGPRTHAWILRPADMSHPLPGVLALHDHGASKFYGKEKVAAGRGSPNAFLKGCYDRSYGGRPFANALAREGFVVLVPDVFLWGSRKFSLKTMPEADRQSGRVNAAGFGGEGVPRQIALYNATACFHEHTVAKYCQALGTTLAGVIGYEDRVAAQYLLGRDDLCNGKIGAIGLSGGGLRAALLRAGCPHIRAAAIVGMMSTYEALFDQQLWLHTWMLYPGPWSLYGDWPDLAGSRAPSPLLVQYDRDDPLFPIDGMKAAHRRLAALYRNAGASKNYRGEFYPGPHKFDLEMQENAFRWLKKQL